VAKAAFLFSQKAIKKKTKYYIFVHIYYISLDFGLFIS